VTGPHFGLNVPYLEMLSVQPQHYEKGRSVLALDLRPELMNSWQVAHGAVVMALLDCAMASASRTMVDHPTGAVTIEMSVNCLHAGTGRLTVEGRVLRSRSARRRRRISGEGARYL